MSSMDSNKLAGSLKVAILTSAISGEVSQKILNRFSLSDRNLIKKLQAQIGRVPSDLKEMVAKEFVEKASIAGISISNKNEQNQGKASSNEGTDPSLLENKKTALKAILSLKPDQLAQLIKDEHPQTIALVIVHLEPMMASEVLSFLPDEIKSDISKRIANLDKVQSGMVEEIDRVFQEILKNKDQTSIQEAGGVAKLAEILNQIDGTIAEQIIDEIEEQDPELADDIRQNMFVFEDIVLVDDKGLQQVLRSVESSELAMALKAASDEAKAHIFNNMSDRAVEILKEEMEVSGAVRMKDVMDAQQKITRIIQDMERKGELIISGRGGEEFVA
jgi:flagellar motor switch protein FliG